MPKSRRFTGFTRRVSQKNQVAIPIILMKKFDILPEGSVKFTATEHGILIEPAMDPIKMGRGIFKHWKQSAQEIKDEIRREEKEYHRRKFGTNIN